MKRLWVLFLCLLSCALWAQTPSPWDLEPSETTADLRGVHAAGGGVVWASGTNGMVLRSQDSGFEWQACAVPPGAEKLDFRAVWAWDDQTAVVMSSGPGALSRVFKTTDGCAHWKLLYVNAEPHGFYDALLFIDRQRGIIVGDPTTSQSPVEGYEFTFRIRITEDGGETWKPVVASGSQPGKELQPLGNEALFAASNSSVLFYAGRLLIGTSQARLLARRVGQPDFRSASCAGNQDPGSLSCGLPWPGWTSTQLPLKHANASSGIFSLAFRGVSNGLSVGGDYAKPQERNGTAAWTSDSGAHWTASMTPPGGYRSAVAWDADHKLWITVGPNGSDISRDDGKTWAPLEHAPADTPKGGEWNALSLPWAVGPHGRIGKLNGETLPK